MQNLAMHLPARAWADYAGSHFSPADWSKIRRLAEAGIEQVKMISYPGALFNGVDTQLEDIRRLRDEVGITSIVFRLDHGRDRLPDPVEFARLHAGKIKHAINSAYLNIAVQPVNEPNLELTAMSPAELTDWFIKYALEHDRLYGSGRVGIISPPIAPHNESSWYWWDNIRGCVEVSDFVGVHVYPQFVGQVDYGVDWWCKQVPDRKVYILECGAPTKTSHAARLEICSRLYREIKACNQVVFASPFVMSGSPEHEEHFYNSDIMTLLTTVAQGAPGGSWEPEPPEIPPGNTNPPESPPVQPGGSLVGKFLVTIERVE
jgi:hypothetical protein